MVIEKSGLTFSEALEALKSGKKVARDGWNGKSQYIILASNITYVDANGTEHTAHHSTMQNRAIVFVGTQGEQVGWLASQADLLSDDWCIVEIL